MTSPVVAVVGGGQLARMMAQAAVGLQVELRALVESPTSSAAQVIPTSSVGAAADADALRRLAADADVLTFEHEHVPGEALQAIRADGHRVEPGPEALLYAQDKIAMRTRLTELGVPCPRWAAVTSRAEIEAFGDDVGWPVVVKTPRGGYDGKGVRLLGRDDAIDWPFPLLLEECVPFERELAALVARRPSGEMRAWSLVQTIQRDGVCAEVLSPAPGLSPAAAAEATQVAATIADGLGVTGVLAVELFDVGGRVLVNELAMRPHNSGHVTIDAATTSQFEQHLRAVLDLPLGDPTQRAPHAVMANVLGSELADPTTAYPALMAELPHVKVHLYGKEVRPGRKLGHVTVVGDDLDALRRDAARAVAHLTGRTATEGTST
ncbi:phosphoribosylaminoimidazole carboxylase, ATPase subunit [Beutenbergia cavernae DSM 12333]|uniref:N5-carboxyaminoimidazole ribonucleotide synthase n=1 Tax=Beutenbergia cavernae (strain ATCC BAA-8 / DSM 12333 / CCUG 43141 / JCM 11478 / NBRC 16432 / NCIMB 13614 / HKI 0122) TaxID=471853 RepID=C5C114_BEUC1|nr:5-(carboxyamino)imidazole ribonucleotide synthase [Beutenbergia cavernae]ACQ79418.1 phosphoribosylaminoimidazole carboxylase, ATPase subunit [Beutenbergia cavernae DSM 12333]